MRTIEDIIKHITAALVKLNRYDSSLDSQIISLAGAVRTLEIANRDIDSLETTIIYKESRYGSEPVPHPAFKVQRDAQDSVTRQMKVLGLTPEDLQGDVDTDPLIEITRAMAEEAGKRKTTIKPRKK